MPSKERHELIETVAQKMQAKWSGGLINWDRLHGQLKKDYRDIAEVAVDAILAALQEPTEGFDPEKVSYHKGMTRLDWWRAMLAASPLSEER